MPQQTVHQVTSTSGQNDPSRGDRFVEAYRWMRLSRVYEEKMASLYRAGKIVGGVYIGPGQEAFSASMGMMLDRERGDVFGALIRDQAGRLAFGEPVIDGARNYFGSVNGPMRGRDGNVHRGRPGRGIPAMISHLGSLISVVNGMLIAKRFRGETSAVGAASIGDGGTSTGAFHEAVNQAAIEKLPLVIAVADNQFAYSTPTDRQFACEDLADRAIGYGIRGYSIDGTDLESCLETFKEAVDRARAGEGPQMVVGKMLRLSGHGEHDDAGYIPEELKEQPFGGDCVKLARARIEDENRLTREELETLESEVSRQVEEAVGRAQSESHPNPFREPWYALSTKHLSEGTPEVSD